MWLLPFEKQALAEENGIQTLHVTKHPWVILIIDEIYSRITLTIDIKRNNSLWEAGTIWVNINY